MTSYQYILNSMGRCGSTLLHDFVFNYYRNNVVDFPMTSGVFIPKISDVRASTSISGIWKTHDPQVPPTMPPPMRICYQFAHPLNVLLSTLKSPTLAEQIHIPEHLGIRDYSEWKNTERWMDEDVLRLEEHFDTWAKPQSCPILLVKYEDIWDNLEEILEYFNIPSSHAVNFPSRKGRQFDWKNASSSQQDRLFKTYGNLCQKIDNFCGVKSFGVSGTLDA